MMRAYFEPSALDSLVRQNVPGACRLELEARGLTPCVGTLTLNECAHPILVDKGDLARELFSYIRDLQPRFLADPSDLYEQEIQLRRDGTPVNPHPHEAQEGFERNEVDGLSDGRISSAFLQLVQRRRKTKLDDWQPHWINYLADVKALRQRFPAQVPTLPKFPIGRGILPA